MTIPSICPIHPALGGLSIAVMLTMTSGCGDNATTAENLAVTAQGQTQTDARDGNVCPPDTPFFRGNLCNGKCLESNERLGSEGTCLYCDEGRIIYKNNPNFPSRNRLEGFFCKIPNRAGDSEKPKKAKKTQPKNKINANCPLTNLSLCGIGAYSHCVNRTNPINGRELCVWNLPQLGYPICTINPNNPGEALCSRTE